MISIDGRSIRRTNRTSTIDFTRNSPMKPAGMGWCHSSWRSIKFVRRQRGSNSAGARFYTAVFSHLGYMGDICWEGADADLILAGNVRVEVKSGNRGKDMLFGPPKHRRINPSKGERKLAWIRDLVIPHDFNRSNWWRMVVIPWPEFAKDLHRSPPLCARHAQGGFLRTAQEAARTRRQGSFHQTGTEPRGTVVRVAAFAR